MSNIQIDLRLKGLVKKENNVILSNNSFGKLRDMIQVNLLNCGTLLYKLEMLIYFIQKVRTLLTKKLLIHVFYIYPM